MVRGRTYKKFYRTKVSYENFQIYSILNRHWDHFPIIFGIEIGINIIYVYVTRFGKRDLFDKNIILRNKQLKMAYICIAMGNRMLVIFTLLSLFFYLTVQCDKLLLGHHLELS